ncbi:MAG TPA: 3-dehydroquinate synthase family protein [Acidimicrobiia bacterium]|nr:3-dehydroquinate synthase family protein [Acidimicrobiia bacterium]
MDSILIGGTEAIIGERWPDPLLPFRPGREKAVVLTQPGPRRIAEEVAGRCRAEIMVLPDRDQAKTLATLGEVYEWLAHQQVGRHDTIVGVGGGAVTDLAGFAAATWQRGVEAVFVPTTLLGAVDAAIGGKTGINLQGKNLVGAFHLPSRVVIDLRVLAALPDHLKREGWAEALKAGLIGDPQLVELFAQRGEQVELAEVVSRAIRVKARVVTEDPREEGGRAVLNFGHTLGHGIELAASWSHGQAVAVGMVAAAAVSARRYGFPDRFLTELIFSLGLPVAAAGVPAETVLKLVAKDKKRTAQGVRMVLLKAVGDPVVEVVSDDELRYGLAAVGVD